MFWNIITVPIARWAQQLRELIGYTWVWEVCFCKYLAIRDPKLGRSQPCSPVLMYGLSKSLEFCDSHCDNRSKFWFEGKSACLHGRSTVDTVFLHSYTQQLQLFVFTVTNLSLTNMCRCILRPMCFLNMSPFCWLHNQKHFPSCVYGRIMALAFTVSDYI